MNLKVWLHNHWIKDNHNKYAKYFEEWYRNLTTSQLQGFENQKYNEINNILC